MDSTPLSKSPDPRPYITAGAVVSWILVFGMLMMVTQSPVLSFAMASSVVFVVFVALASMAGLVLTNAY